MLFTIRELVARPWVGRAAAVLAVGLVLGFAGPFKSYPPLSAPVRYAFWMGMAVMGYLTALAAERLIAGRSFVHPGLRLGAVALASALPLTFVVAWAISFLRPGHVYKLLELPALFLAVSVIQLGLVFILMRKPDSMSGPSPAPRDDKRAAVPEPALAPAMEQSNKFPRTLLSRLPERLGNEIVALEAEDHYLRVHTLLGSDLILMRLSDAIAAMAPESGLQVHRSWWVAHDSVSDIVRSEQRSQLHLRNGLTVPVGRTYSAAVRAHADRLRRA